MKILAYIGLAFIINIGCYAIKSPYLSEFLTSNIVTIILTLLAINTATSSVLTSKLDDISKNHSGFSFAATYRELKKSLFEQLILLVLSVVVLIILNSKLLKDNVDCLKEGSDIALTTIFIYTIDILRDTGVAIFEIMAALQKQKDEGNTN